MLGGIRGHDTRGGVKIMYQMMIHEGVTGKM